MTRKYIPYLFLSILLLLNSCKSTQVAPAKPKPEVITKSFDLSKKTKFLKIDFAKSKKFNIRIKRVKRITIKYKLSTESAYNEDEIRASMWHKELEKSLIRMGFIINEEETVENIFLDDEEKKDEICDASIIIDRVMLNRNKNIYNFTLDKAPDGRGLHAYEYYISEINGKMIMKNNDIIWSCNILASSFDVLKINKKTKPIIKIRGIRDYRYSEKLNKWMRDKWIILSEDNFQLNYSEKVQDDFHKRDIIKYMISGFIKTITKKK